MDSADFLILIMPRLRKIIQFLHVVLMISYLHRTCILGFIEDIFIDTVNQTIHIVQYEQFVVHLENFLVSFVCGLSKLTYTIAGIIKSGIEKIFDNLRL